jgi:hypothetical protein
MGSYKIAQYFNISFLVWIKTCKSISTQQTPNFKKKNLHVKRENQSSQGGSRRANPFPQLGKKKKIGVSLYIRRSLNQQPINYEDYSDNLGKILRLLRFQHHRLCPRELYQRRLRLATLRGLSPRTRANYRQRSGA